MGTPVMCTEAEQQWHKPRTMVLPIGKMSIIKATKKRMAGGGIRSTLYSALLGTLPDLSVLQIEEAYKNFDPLSKPLICNMGMSTEKLLRLPLWKGTGGEPPVLPAASNHNVTIVHHKETPPFPSLPLDGYRLESNFQGCTCVLSEEGQLHIVSSGERIHRDPVVFSLIREKGDWYYLCVHAKVIRQERLNNKGQAPLSQLMKEKQTNICLCN